jgi:hypothetical protein
VNARADDPDARAFIASPSDAPDFENPIDDRPFGDAIKAPGVGSLSEHLVRKVSVSRSGMFIVALFSRPVADGAAGASAVKCDVGYWLRLRNGLA